MFVSIGSAMIDDIVWPDGRTQMGVVGGGGPHAAAGMAFALGYGPIQHNSGVGLVSLVGDGFPDGAMQTLQARFDVHGCIRKPMPHPRAWQLFEHDGRRTEVFRQGDPAVLINIPEPEELPPAYHKAIGWHLLREGGPARKWMDHLKHIAPSATILWEPAQRYMRPENHTEFVSLLPMADIVSPNLEEAAAVYENQTRDARLLMKWMLDGGAQRVALRMGAQGSLLADTTGRMILTPAEPVSEEHIVDQTGAGNMFCGAFLVEWCRTGDLHRAGIVGASAGKAALGQCGLWLG